MTHRLTRIQVLLLVHYFSRRIAGNTKLQKLAFLVDNELKERRLTEEAYVFIPHLFGPFSKEVYADEEVLEAQGWVRAEDFDVTLDSGEMVQSTIYRLTEEGEVYVQREILDRMNAEVRQRVELIVERHRTLPTKKLLRVIYTKYPKFATKSVLSLKDLE